MDGRVGSEVRMCDCRRRRECVAFLEPPDQAVAVAPVLPGEVRRRWGGSERTHKHHHGTREQVVDSPILLAEPGRKDSTCSLKSTGVCACARVLCARACVCVLTVCRC